MKYKTLFRLLLKAIGVWIFAGGMAQGITSIGWVIQSFSASAGVSTGPYFSAATYLAMAGSLTQPALGLYLFFGGKWIVNLAIPGNRPYCPECAYDLTGAPVERCPECGTAFRWGDVKPKTEEGSEK